MKRKNKKASIADTLRYVLISYPSEFSVVQDYITVKSKHLDRKDIPFQITGSSTITLNEDFHTNSLQEWIYYYIVAMSYIIMASWERSKPISRLETSWKAWEVALLSSAVDIADDMIHYAKSIGLGDESLAPHKLPGLLGKKELFNLFQQADLISSTLDPTTLKLEDYYVQIRHLFEDDPEGTKKAIEGVTSISGIPSDQAGGQDGDNNDESNDDTEESQSALDKLLSPDNLGSDIQSIEESWQDILSSLVTNGELAASDKHAGKGNGSLSHLFKKLEKAKTPWYVYLAAFVQRCFDDEKESDWSHPSRRVTASQQKYFLPNQKSELEKVPYLTICMDTSGSCWNDETLQLFANNMITLSNKLASTIEFIEFDYGVLSRQVLQDPTPESLKKLLSTYKISGGGGTSFEQTVDYLEGTATDAKGQFRPPDALPTVCIFLTDGYATFPEKSKFPIIWMLDGTQSKSIEQTCQNKLKRWMMVDAGEGKQNA